MTYSENSTTKFGLRQSQLDHIVGILKSNPNVNELLLFGSRAKGNFRQSADVDIAIKGERLTLNDLLDMSNSLDSLWLPFKIDLINYTKISEANLIQHIERIGQTIYKKS